MQQTVLLAFGVLDGIAQWERLFVSVSRSSAVQGQTDEAAVFESLVALGLVQRSRQRQPCRFRVQPLGAVSQAIIPGFCMDAQLRTHRRMHQPLQAQETRRAQNVAQDHRPDQIRSRNMGMRSTVAGVLEVGLQPQTMTGIVLDLAEMWALQRGCCFRRSTSNSALAVRTSRRAS